MGDVLSLLLACAPTLILTRILGWHPIDLPETLVWGALWLIWRGYQGLYPGYGRSPQTELRLHVVGTLQVAGVQLAAALAIQRLTPTPPSALVLWALLLVTALTMRYALRSLLIRWGQYGRPISVIGAGHTAELAIAHLCQHPAYGLNPVYAYDDNPELQGRHVRGVPVIGPIELALTMPRTQQALISIPGARAETQRRLVNGIYSAFPLTWVIPDLFGVPNQGLQTHSIGAIASLEIRNNLRSLRSRLVKRILDLLCAIVCTVLALPLLLIIAVAIRLESKGPVIYKAYRLGRYGQPFPCYKFRSMHEDAEQRLESLLKECPELRHEYETFHKLKQDPRVTRIGGLLRMTSLDELPQLWNVLMGQMSLVGPRPYLPRESQKIGHAIDTILRVRPGMTGYWQVNDRSESTFEQRVDMDQFYIANWSPWLDLVILLQTVRVVVRGMGAY
nr:undecaprenyl-phosphate galactose phosphotransferase WbaP [Deinococcus humi]